MSLLKQFFFFFYKKHFFPKLYQEIFLFMVFFRKIYVLKKCINHKKINCHRNVNQGKKNNRNTTVGIDSLWKKVCIFLYPDTMRPTFLLIYFKNDILLFIFLLYFNYYKNKKWVKSVLFIYANTII